MSVMIDAIAKKRSVIWEYARDIATAVCGSVVIAMAAPISYQLPFSVIPLTIQPHVALLVAFLLGRRRGPIAIMLFIMQGVAGYPVFAGGAFGLANLLGPRGGYLVGYFMAALFMGNFRPAAYLKTLLIFAGANSVIYVFGAVWLSSFIGPYKAITLGVLPFLLGDAVKVAVVAKIALLLRRDFSFQRQI